MTYVGSGITRTRQVRHVPRTPNLRRGKILISDYFLFVILMNNLWIHTALPRKFFTNRIFFINYWSKNFFLWKSSASSKTSKTPKKIFFGLKLYEENQKVLFCKPYWPARSPDLTPLDYFLWGYVKEMVYSWSFGKDYRRKNPSNFCCNDSKFSEGFWKENCSLYGERWRTCWILIYYSK